MIDIIFKVPKTRFALVCPIGMVAIIGFVLMRGLLLMRAWPFMDNLAYEWIYIFGQGLVYDIAFISYFSIPFIFLLIILPNKWFSSQIFNYLTQTISFLILYALGFSLVAEWFFWSEFGVRFNFISVDYLVYTREVIDNIVQSYPVFLILPVLFVVTSFAFCLIRVAILRPLALRESFKKRAAAGGLMMLVPLLCFLLLDQSQRCFSDNNYINELASNGPYQLFAAFRNNTLDYRQFYATGSDAKLSRVLKQQIQNKQVVPGDSLYNISRRIEANDASKKLNVILISVESLSAKFLTRFGQKKDITPVHGQMVQERNAIYPISMLSAPGRQEALKRSPCPSPRHRGAPLSRRPDNERMFSLGKVFKDMRYDTAFLYGGRGFFDNMNAFFSGNGYRIVDQSCLNHSEITFKNAWGVCDEDPLQPCHP